MAGFEPGLHISGQGGALIQGWNELTRLKHWVASPSTRPQEEGGGPCLRLSVGGHEPDPYWFDNYDPEEDLSLEIKIGKAEVTRPARIVSASPLVIEAWQED